MTAMRLSVLLLAVAETVMDETLPLPDVWLTEHHDSLLETVHDAFDMMAKLPSPFSSRVMFVGETSNRISNVPPPPSPLPPLSPSPPHAIISSAAVIDSKHAKMFLFFIDF
jgi:hypothetical protein